MLSFARHIYGHGRTVSDFVLAKSFSQDDQQTRIERIGHALVYLQQRCADAVLRNIKNPIFLAGTTLALATVISVIFYPERVLRIKGPLKPWMLKLSIYVVTQVTILGLGMRTYGRFEQPQLFANWLAGEITARLPGDVEITRPSQT